MEKETIKHILNVIRRGTITWKVRTQCLNRYRVKKIYGTLKNGKPKYKYFYPCEKCKEFFDSSSKLEVDHIEEVGSFNGNFDDYIKRMYCPIDNLQALCSICHQKKTSNFNSFLRYKRKIL
jgi:5-methylcytosine-specific restriction endonuclease McrA